MRCDHQTTRQLDFLYENIGQLSDPCTYCGMDASGWDHIPPLHFISRIDVKDIKHKLRKVPCCKECNCIIGGILLFTIQERRSYVKRHLKIKYRSILKIPKWNNCELSELGYSLYTSALGGSNKSDSIRYRLSWDGSKCQIEEQEIFAKVVAPKYFKKMKMKNDQLKDWAEAYYKRWRSENV